MCLIPYNEWKIWKKKKKKCCAPLWETWLSGLSTSFQSTLPAWALNYMYIQKLLTNVSLNSTLLVHQSTCSLLSWKYSTSLWWFRLSARLHSSGILAAQSVLLTREAEDRVERTCFLTEDGGGTLLYGLVAKVQLVLMLTTSFCPPPLTPNPQWSERDPSHDKGERVSTLSYTHW